MALRQAIDLPSQLVDVAADRHEPRIVAVQLGMRRWAVRHGFPVVAGGRIIVGRGIDDERVQPLADRKPGAARGVPCDLARIGTNPFYVPRHVSHAHSGIWAFGRNDTMLGSSGAAPTPKQRLNPNEGFAVIIRTFSGLG